MGIAFERRLKQVRQRTELFRMNIVRYASWVRRQPRFLHFFPPAVIVRVQEMPEYSGSPLDDAFMSQNRQSCGASGSGLQE